MWAIAQQVRLMVVWLMPEPVAEKIAAVWRAKEIERRSGVQGILLRVPGSCGRCEAGPWKRKMTPTFRQSDEQNRSR